MLEQNVQKKKRNFLERKIKFSKSPGRHLPIQNQQ